ncbi:MAG: PEP/pyruvate-binding domain-containing protein [Patescibacteria group bacterium]|mgnify:FL=1
MSLIREFGQLGKHDAAIAGGKGASLGEMTQAGIPVPPGFVILSDAFERFLEETDLNTEIDATLHTVSPNEMHTVEHASEKIQALILGAKMPEDIASEIQKLFAKLDAEFVAVRSSATAEDSASAAWAGQLDSFLNTTNETLLTNVQRCWASLFTPRAIFYRFEKELHKQKISVAVVVQKMVQSEVSGIAFSVHPVTEDYNQLIIEAGFGLGEAIVSGSVTPDSYVVEKEPRRIIDKNVTYQSRALWRAANGGNEWRALSEEEGTKPALSDEQALELAEIILRIEKHYGFPCDIEWAYEAGTFFITQSRPITTLAPLAEKPISENKCFCN